MRHPIIHLTALVCLLATVSCKQEPAAPQDKPATAGADGALLQVGTVTVTQADLDYQLQEKHAGRSDAASRKAALDELAERAAFTQAARDAGLDGDPVARAEIARILSSRLREKELSPRLKAIAADPIPESRLRAIYESQKERFQSAEKRQVAVLWLNPGADPERTKIYQDKMAQALDWYSNNSELAKQPAQGFSVLSVDYSEHTPSRYKDGVIGWLERAGGVDAWTKAVAEIAFSLKQPGETSGVVTKPVGVFLVRYMAGKPAFLRSFEDVSTDLDQAERKRLREAAETEFQTAIKAKYPVRTTTQPTS